MRTGTLATALLLLLLAWSAAISATKEPAGGVPEAPRPMPASPRPAPLPGDVAAPSEELARPTNGEAGISGGGFSAEPSGSPSAYQTGPCAQSPSSCGRCGGCRHNAECGQMAFGASVNAAMKTQICNGIGARMVLYHYDFCDAQGPDADKLNEHGIARLRDIVRMFQCLTCHPIMIEYTSGNSALDAKRREYVVQTLNAMNASIPDPLVVVGKPETPALSGREAILLDGSETKTKYESGLMQRTKKEGQNPPPSPAMQDTGGSQSGGSMLGGSSGGSGQ